MLPCTVAAKSDGKLSTPCVVIVSISIALAALPEKGLTSAVGNGDDFRADISSVVATRIVNYCLTHAEKHAVGDPMIKRLIKLTTDCDAFTNDLKYFMVKEIVNGNKVKFAAMMRDNAVVKMAVK